MLRIAISTGHYQYAQNYGIDYDETFAPVARMDTIRAVLTITTQNQWHVYKMDVKSSFFTRYY